MAEKFESAAKFSDDPEGWARRWQAEFDAARKSLEKWKKQAEEVDKRYHGELEGGRASVNLYPANIDQREAQLYGQTPKVDAKRRNPDAADDDARTGAEMLSRLLNNDVERDEDSYPEAIGLALKDWLLVDLGNVRCRYVAEFEDVPEVPAQVDPATGMELAAAVPATRRKVFEDVETDYVHYEDQLWSPCRTFQECRWWAFAADMTRDEMVTRFGEEVGKVVPLATSYAGKVDPRQNELEADPWSRARVWEVWHKETRRVFWFVEGYRRTLDDKPDPLGLKRFWPFTRPLVSGCTNKAFVPQPSYCRAQDIYNEIDELEIRIRLLTRSVKIAGCYDKSCGPLKTLLNSKAENELVPVDNWALFAEKGGLQGHMVFLPLKEITEAISVLTEKQLQKFQLLFQVTGQSDLERGQAAASATATEQAIKARSSGVRGQRMQDVFAAFATGVQKIRAEIIGLHFDPETILQRSNVAATDDAERALRAAALLKDQMAEYRIKVSADSVSMTDFAALRQERGEAMQAVAAVLQAAPVMIPVLGPVAGKKLLLQLVQWQLAGCRGSSVIEAAIDQAIEEAAKQPPPGPPPPDPKLEAAKMKGALDMQKGQLDIAGKKVDLQAKMMGAQADMARTRLEMQATAQDAAVGERERMWGRNAELAQKGQL